VLEKTGQIDRQTDRRIDRKIDSELTSSIDKEIDREIDRSLEKDSLYLDREGLSMYSFHLPLNMHFLLKSYEKYFNFQKKMRYCEFINYLPNSHIISREDLSTSPSASLSTTSSLSTPSLSTLSDTDPTFQSCLLFDSLSLSPSHPNPASLSLSSYASLPYSTSHSKEVESSLSPHMSPISGPSLSTPSLSTSISPPLSLSTLGCNLCLIDIEMDNGEIERIECETIHMCILELFSEKEGEIDLDGERVQNKQSGESGQDKQNGDSEIDRQILNQPIYSLLDLSYMLGFKNLDILKSKTIYWVKEGFVDMGVDEKEEMEREEDGEYDDYMAKGDDECMDRETNSERKIDRKDRQKDRQIDREEELQAQLEYESLYRERELERYRKYREKEREKSKYIDFSKDCNSFDYSLIEAHRLMFRLRKERKKNN
jgi:hypothetical protein